MSIIHTVELIRFLTYRWNQRGRLIAQSYIGANLGLIYDYILSDRSMTSSFH